MSIEKSMVLSNHMQRIFTMLKYTSLLLFCFLSTVSMAVDIYRLDGNVYHNVKDLEQFDDIYLFKKNGRTYTLDAGRIDKIIDDKGNIIYKRLGISVKKIVKPGEATKFVFIKNGKRQAVGYWLENGIFFIDGNLLDAIYKVYSDSGRLERTFTVKNNMLNGSCKVYYPSGRVKEEGFYKNNREEGTTKSYYPTGELKGEAAYKNGLKDGITKLFYRSGNLQMTINFKQNIPVGLQKTFYESGKLKTEVAYKNGLKSGEFKSYYESGKLSMKGTYIDGKEDGVFITYYESGREKKKTRFVMGEVLKK